MAEPGKGDGLMRWLVGGLLVGLVVLGLVVGGYAIGHDRGETAGREAAATSTQPVETAPATTESAPTTTSAAELAAQGKALFAPAGCAGCHTLADAGASGSVGPNLDDAKPTAALVVDRVTNGKGAMPSFSGQLSKDEIEALAAYVSQATGG